MFFIFGLTLPMTISTGLSLPTILYICINMHFHVYNNRATIALTEHLSLM